MNQFNHHVENLTGAWNSFQQIAFEGAGLKAVFEHVRNLVLATLIIAAGVHANVYWPHMPALAIFEFEPWGYGVAAVGFILAILNLLDGLYKLARMNTPILLRVVVIMFYLFFAVRVAQLIYLFRISSTG
jgi:phosphoglycerol transferase MdoB-like AlkP superfamily enzyme